MSKAKREKVLVLKNLQQFEEATGLAKENYYLYSDNPYHIQAYFDCLINTYHNRPEDDLLLDLLEKLGRIRSEKAQSMYGRCRALYLAYVEDNFEAALSCIDKAAINFPKDKKYALIVKFDGAPERATVWQSSLRKRVIPRRAPVLRISHSCRSGSWTKHRSCGWLPAPISAKHRMSLFWVLLARARLI